MTSSKFGMQGVCKPGQFVHSGAGRSGKKSLAGQKNSLVHMLESSVCLGLIAASRVNHTQRLCSVRAGQGLWPSCLSRAAMPVKVTYTQDSVS